MGIFQGAMAVGALLLPGWALAGTLRLGAPGLERLLVGVALGRCLLAALTLAGGSLGLAPLVPAWCGLAWLGGCAALAGALRTRTRRGAGLPRGATPAGTLLAPGVLALGSLAVALAVVGVSGREGDAGSLVFHGHHATNDSLVYAAMGGQAAQAGFPLVHPFLAGVTNFGHSLFFASIGGLALASGLGPADVAFRLRPALDLVALTLTGFVLAQRLGATRAGACLGALLVLFGGGLSQPVFWAAAALGVRLNELEIWSYGSAFLLPFNPATPGLQTAWCALLLLLPPAGAPLSRAAAVTAGLLAAAVFELKATLWVSFVPALAAAAFAFAAPARVRLAAGVAVLASLPLLLTSPGVVPREAEPTSAALRFCFACFPRYAVASAIQDPVAMTGLFDAFSAARLASPRFWAGSLGASALYLATTLGVALLALVPAWRGEPHGSASGAAFGARVLWIALAAGAVATCAFDTPPHFVNAGQFAWCAGLGLWLLLGAGLGRRLAAGRWAAVACVLALALPTGTWWLLVRGAGAPEFDRVTAAERALAEAARGAVPAEAVVLEPSLLVTPTRVSPIAWLGGRRLFASKEGFVLYLEPAERARRVELLERVYRAADRGTAELALVETGARFVVTSGGLGTALEGSRALRRIFANDAGTLWEVAGAPVGGAAR